MFESGRDDVTSALKVRFREDRKSMYVYIYVYIYMYV
jgi:hypothetical protein